MKCARTLALTSAAVFLSAAAWGQISGTLATYVRVYASFLPERHTFLCLIRFEVSVCYNAHRFASLYRDDAYYGLKGAYQR